MPEVILRGKAGAPKTEQKGSLLIVSKDIKEAVLEERHPAKRIKGKSTPAVPTFTEEQVKAKVKAAERVMKTITGDGVSDKANSFIKEMEVKFAKASSDQAKELEDKFTRKTKMLKNTAMASKAQAKTVKAVGKDAVKRVGAKAKEAVADIAQLKQQVQQSTQSAYDQQLLHTTEQEKLKTKVGQQKADITRLRQERNKAREAAGGAGGTTTPKAKAAGSGVPMTPAQRGRSRTPAR